jgi:Glycosyl transferase family 2
MVDKLVAPYIVDLQESLGRLHQKVDHIDARLDIIQTDVPNIGRESRDIARAATDEIVAVTREVASQSELEFGRMTELSDRIVAILKYIDDERAANRRRLYELRESDDYELAWTEPDPLVSFIVPTYDRFESLRDVALPSMLAQTHANVEVIVVGDAAPPETAAVIEEIGDERVRYYNRPVRGPYPEDKSVRWYMLGSPPYNDALSLVRGRWIGAMADDDAVRPDFAETLLAGAREGRHENCYGRYRVHYKGGEVLELGKFPPQKGNFVTQAALYHAGLRFFMMSAADPYFEEPNDWALCRRMMDAGVRYGMIEDFVCDKYESRYEKHADWGTQGIPTVD